MLDSLQSAAGCTNLNELDMEINRHHSELLSIVARRRETKEEIDFVKMNLKKLLVNILDWVYKCLY